MEHNEAVEIKATEQYLLDEMTPELREAFEQHLFDCAECTLDLRAASAFIEEAKLLLPELIAAPNPVSAPIPAPAPTPRPTFKEDKKPGWLSAWLRPAFAVPAFAALLAVVGYQNLATIPSLRTSAAELRSQASEPRILPAWTLLHVGTRGGASNQPIAADTRQGALLILNLPANDLPAPDLNASHSASPDLSASAAHNYTSYKLDLYDPQGKLSWTHTVEATQDSSGSRSVPLDIPGGRLQPGSYSLVISGVIAGNSQKEIDRRILMFTSSEKKD